MRRAYVAALAVVTACAPAAPTSTVRGLVLPSTFDGSAAGASIGALDWRAFFDDAHLNALIAEALANNLDLQGALQRIEVARAGLVSAGAARLPRLELAASAAIRRYGLYTMDGAGNASTDIRPGQRVPEHLPDLFLGVQASWEADLWGRLKGLHGAARARYLATVEGTNLVVTNLVAEIAAGYFDLLALDYAGDILTETVARQAEGVELVKIQKEAGRATELAVQQFEAQLATTRAMHAATKSQIRELENQLNVLAGRLPQPIARDKARLRREVPGIVAAGVPSALLHARSDIREAELAVQATKLDVGAARAAFYPQLRISAHLGYQAFDPRFLLSTPASVAYGLVGGLVAPVVNRRSLAATFRAAHATQLEAMYRYQSVVLRAFTEVATGLYVLEQAREIVGHQIRKQAAIAGSRDAAGALFDAGKATYLDVLFAQQSTLDAELELIRALRDQHVAHLRLYRALGGGWRGTLTVAAD